MEVGDSMINEHGAAGGMKIGRGKRSTRRTTPQWQKSHMTWYEIESRRWEAKRPAAWTVEWHGPAKAGSLTTLYLKAQLLILYETGSWENVRTERSLFQWEQVMKSARWRKGRMRSVCSTGL
jgi:hypothetical protein